MTEERKAKIKWKPRKWRPEYDRIVAMSCLGKSGTEIAAVTNYTPEHISVILNLDQAKEFAEKIRGKLAERFESTIAEDLSATATMAAKRIREVMESDVLFEKNPFQIIDRGLDVLKGLGHLRGGGNGAGTGVLVNAPGGAVFNNVPIETLQKLAEGMRTAKEVEKVHADKYELKSA